MESEYPTQYIHAVKEINHQMYCQSYSAVDDITECLLKAVLNMEWVSLQIPNM